MTNYCKNCYFQSKFQFEFCLRVTVIKIFRLRSSHFDDELIYLQKCGDDEERGEELVPIPSITVKVSSHFFE